MVKKNKVLLGLTLSAIALGCGAFMMAQAPVAAPQPFEETASDRFNNEAQLDIRSAVQIGSGQEVSVSKTFVQYGMDDAGNYCMRFATAVKGNISSMTYVRKGIAGIGDGQDKRKTIESVYVGVTAGDNVFYYDGANVTTNEKYKGEYYWACYTIGFSSAEYYDLGIEVSLEVEGEEVASRETSLNQVIENGNPVPQACPISYVANEDVEISVPESAIPGAVVEVGLTYDVANVRVRRVLANDMECGIDGDGNYYFVMPHNDVEISVVSERIAKTRSITNTNEGIVTLHGVDSKAEVGEMVSFSFSVAAGYSFTGNVTVREANAFDPETAATYEVSYENGLYSFEMPNADVEIIVEVRAGVFTVSENDELGLISTIYSDGTSIYYGYAAYNTTIKVTFYTNHDKYQVKGARIVETQQEIMIPEGQTYIEFTMPYYGITLEPIYEIRTHAIEIINAEHVSLVPYSKNADGEYVALESSRAAYEEMVYLKPVSEDPESYSVNEIKGSYLKKGSSYASSLSLTLNEDGYYEFSMPNVDLSSKVTITVTEKNLTLFKEYEFVGNYLGLNACSNKAYTTFNSSYSPVIDSAGILKKSATASSSYTIESATAKTGQGEMTFSSGKKAIYGGNILFGHYSFSSDPICTDMLVAVKKENTTDSDSSYELHVEMFNSRKSTVVTAFKDGELYAAGYIDGVNGIAYLENVTIEMTEGTYVTDTNASYTIKANGKVITNVTYSGAGGAANRVLVDVFKGSYTSSEGETLEIDGTSSATLNGETYSYSKNEEGQIILTKGLTTIVIEVDLDNNTFVIISEDVYEAADELDLRTFTGYCEDSYYDEYNVKLEFVGNGNVKFTITQYQTYIGSGVTAEQTAQTSYILDKETMTLTINVFLFSSSSSTVEIKFNVSSDFNSLTFTSGIPGYSTYYVNGQTLTAA